MTNETCSTAMCQCSMGTTPASFQVLPEDMVFTEDNPAATIMDNKLGVNFSQPVSTFGQCLSMANPETMAKTISNLGVLTPGTCMPMFPAPWMPGSMTVMIKDKPALGDSSQLLCIYMGMITFITPGEFTVEVPA